MLPSHIQGPEHGIRVTLFGILDQGTQRGACVHGFRVLRLRRQFLLVCPLWYWYHNIYYFLP